MHHQHSSLMVSSANVDPPYELLYSPSNTLRCCARLTLLVAAHSFGLRMAYKMCLLSGISFMSEHFINCSAYTVSNEDVVAKADHTLSHPMERSPSWKANRFSASQEIP